MEDKINKLAKKSKTIKMAKEMLQEISADELMREQYYAREKARLDAKSRLKYAEVMGMKRGKGQGKVELLMHQLKRKFETFPEVYETRLQNAREDIVDRIAEDIFDIDRVEDLDKYLP